MNPTNEEMIADLEAAGWTRASETMWRSPIGTRFPGPRGAWLVRNLCGPSDTEIAAVLAGIEAEWVCNPAKGE